MELQGKNALITGGAIRIGKAIVLALAQAGCNVFIHYQHSADEAVQTQREAEAFGVRAWRWQADFTLNDQVLALIEAADKETGGLDILVNNAALYYPGNAAKTTLDSWEIQFAVNLRAPFLLCREFARRLPPEKRGAIVQIADAVCFRPAPDHFAYRLTKSALISMTQMLAIELAPRITVNAVAPGIMMPLAGHPGKTLEGIAQTRIPLRRIGSPQFVADNVLHLLHQDFVTGVILPVDGGEHI